MSTGMKMAMRTFVMYLANVLMCGLFVLWFSWTWLQTLLSIALMAGFGLMCYNEGGWNGERDVTLERTAQKRMAEGKAVDQDTMDHVFNRKHAATAFLVVSLPLCALAVVNLLASPAYPAPAQVQEVSQEQASEDPFAYDVQKVEKMAQLADAVPQEPAWQPILRIVTRIAFIPLLPLYAPLENNPTLLYALFIPFSFVLPACTAIGYLRGPQIREKKIEEIARGKVRKRKSLRVGGILPQQGPHTPKQPKPKV